ncbi:hypothetical protein PHYPSEUDO_005529 [Phytophthora pseudosyringae]|uniref:Uncharacterized protein n=1 Tax=Phytophthora pseudosyringae TaxID=221518 RepID=A0A8T1WF10_9STRA|nr:hypothetical protein PHYPSEUDO_005529 [Phytophthora pseudosyringae]
MVSTAKVPNRAGKKRRDSTETALGKNIRKQKSSPRLTEVADHNDSPAGRFLCVLEQVSSVVLGHLSSDVATTLILSCPSAFSRELVHTKSLEAIRNVPRTCHLGCQCRYDWIKRLDFVPRPTVSHGTHALNEALSVFQAVGGAPHLLNAVTLTNRLWIAIRTFKRQAPRLVPIVCPLVTKETLSQCTKKEVAKAMNRICCGAGSRFFRETQKKRTMLGSFDEHWSGIEEDSCQYCDILTASRDGMVIQSRRDSIERVITLCQMVYRRLKVGMVKNLQFVRFIPRPSGLDCAWGRGSGNEPYEGLVAGITKGGILSGFYFERGSKTSL